MGISVVFLEPAKPQPVKGHQMAFREKLARCRRRLYGSREIWGEKIQFESCAMRPARKDWSEGAKYNKSCLVKPLTKTRTQGHPKQHEVLPSHNFSSLKSLWSTRLPRTERATLHCRKYHKPDPKCRWHSRKSFKKWPAQLQLRRRLRYLRNFPPK